MKKSLTGIAFAALVGAAALSGCQSVGTAVRDTVELPVRAVEGGVHQVGKGVKGVGKVGEDIIGPILTDRNRFALLREHREMAEHYTSVERYIERRQVDLDARERRILLNARDDLAAVRRQLDAERIPAGLGVRLYKQLDGVRQTFDLLHNQHNTPAYTGFIADR